jgi:hypothetical protein
MATTTNYGWTTPDDTALVKDGAAAIRTLGSSVDTTTKNLNPETTLGDIAYRSSTANVNTRLGIGTAGQVLQVNSGANAPEWATPSSGGMTLISTTTLSGASVSLTSIPQTYNNLQIVVRLWLPATTNTSLRLRLNSDATANRHKINYAYGSLDFSYDLTSIPLTGNARNSASSTIVVANIYDYKNTTTPKIGDHIGVNTETSANFTLNREHWAYSETSAITSLDFFSLSGNMTSGTVLLYGVK